MLKRTKGYILLTLLVITGFASQTPRDTLTGKERKELVSNLKDSKEAFLKSITGLSPAQLNFKAAPDKWSIKECIYHIALSEKGLWSMTDAILKQPLNPEKQSQIKQTDADLVAFMGNRAQKVQAPESFRPEEAKWTTMNEALDAFKKSRTNLIKYVKTTTDDARNHVAQTSFGYVDAYQLMLMIATHSARHTQQIEEVKAYPHFPEK